MPNEEKEEQANFKSFVNWAFQAMLLALCAWGVTELSGVNKSVQELNVKMAVVLERDQVRSEQVKEILRRLDNIEGQ